MGVCEAKPHVTTHSSPGVCRISCLVLRVELPSERRLLDDLVELSSAGIFNISTPFTLDAWARPWRRKCLDFHLPETQERSIFFSQ